ncbi:phosphoribosylpyrophosphate synthetase [Niabella sp. CC-SYL272]|uniref:phosphoribosylpyrophosphate synthetase n=1 Tax=Niabella agricola TaxID=2891571 RepID=UPI001F3BB261|nr:phosphoribosylpyrophosphate synthetase [Niabella agricola]MCF3110544.1 phosphoribosylpyrophosphate synthetase [Niabella agricola]
MRQIQTAIAALRTAAALSILVSTYKRSTFDRQKLLVMNAQTPHYSYDTLSEAVDDLIRRGYTEDFLAMEEKDCLYCNQHSLELSPEEFEIDEVYRFEGMTDPADESIVFAISSQKHQIKGTVINSFGADFGYRSSKLVAHLKQHRGG